jgi:MFS transporter, DHA1 family, quinolone resistance protein
MGIRIQSIALEIKQLSTEMTAMTTSESVKDRMHQRRVAKWLTCLMFMMFAMTSDAVGSVIPAIIREFNLSMKAAGAFHYVPMTAIAIGAILFGFMAARLGRKRTIIVGLAVYGISSLLFAFGNSFVFFVVLLGAAGFGISIFKIGALALVGDLSESAEQHSGIMNTVEGFFGFGGIIGPAIVAAFLVAGLSWKWLYVVAAVICALLIVLAAFARFPDGVVKSREEPVNIGDTLVMLKNPYALGFSLLIMLYVSVEVAIYVWMPTYLGYSQGTAARLSAYALTVFFVLRAGGRFMGSWLLARYSWTLIMATFALAIFVCFLGSLVGGASLAVFLLPLSGLFMSMIYPTLNSKGISCFPKAEHGVIAGVILFFTAVAAAAGPLAMGAISDAYGDARYGFWLATGFAFLLLLGLLFNHIANPACKRLAALGQSEYGPTD